MTSSTCKQRVKQINDPAKPCKLFVAMFWVYKWYDSIFYSSNYYFPPKRPVPPDPWNGVMDTLDIPPACPQPGEGVAYIEFHVPGFNSTSEDCLYLNIYTPKVSIPYQTSFLAKFRLLPDILPRDVILYEEYRYLFYTKYDINP